MHCTTHCIHNRRLTLFIIDANSAHLSLYLQPAAVKVMGFSSSSCGQMDNTYCKHGIMTTTPLKYIQVKCPILNGKLIKHGYVITKLTLMMEDKTKTNSSSKTN